MRIFTEQDKLALAAALQTFYAYLTGMTVRINACQEHVEKALAGGITVDELLNMNNYRRLAEALDKPDLAAYIDALLYRKLPVLTIKEEDDWKDPDTFIYYSEMFHDFYQKINGKGGTYTTSTAKMNLVKAITRNSFQAILSEKLILETMEKTGQGENLTCFNYLVELLHNAENYDIDNSLSDEQEYRKKLSEPVEMEEAQKDEHAETVERESDEDQNVKTESAATQNDESLYADPADMYTFNENNMGDIDDILSGDEDEHTDVAFISSFNPKQFKRNHIANVILGLTISDIVEFTQYLTNMTQNPTLEEFIGALTEGNINKKMESVTAREIHMFLNGELHPNFLECVRMQGVTISEETASKYDVLTEGWDMRNDNVRKIQKLKELIYMNAGDDADLQSVLTDLERMYQEN